MGKSKGKNEDNESDQLKQLETDSEEPTNRFGILERKEVNVFGKPEIDHLLNVARKLCNACKDAEKPDRELEKFFGKKDKNWKKSDERKALLRAAIGCGLDAAMRAAFGDGAPKPFALIPNGRRGEFTVLGYSSAPKEYLLEQRQSLATPVLEAAFPYGGIPGKAIPQAWRAGRSFGF